MKKVLRYFSAFAFVFLLGIGVMLGSNQSKAATKKNVTVHVKLDNVNWDSVNVYTYQGDGELAGKWPGKAMKLNGEWYEYTFQTSSVLNLVFNCGDKQTNNVTDLKNTKSDYYITIAPGNGKKNEMGAIINFYASVVKEKAAQTVTAPAKAKVTKAKFSGKKYVTVTYKKVSGADGYQVYLRKGKNASYKLVKTVNKGTTVSCKIKAAKGSNYAVRVRAFKVNGNNKVYGKYSAGKQVK